MSPFQTWTSPRQSQARTRTGFMSPAVGTSSSKTASLEQVIDLYIIYLMIVRIKKIHSKSRSSLINLSSIDPYRRRLHIDCFGLSTNNCKKDSMWTWTWNQVRSIYKTITFNLHSVFSIYIYIMEHACMHAIAALAAWDLITPERMCPMCWWTVPYWRARQMVLGSKHGRLAGWLALIKI